MSVKYQEVHSGLMSLMNLIQSDPDPINKLSNLARLSWELESLIYDARYEVAYEAKTKMSTKTVAERSGMSIDTLFLWCRKHRQRTGKPVIGRRRKQIRSGRDLSHLRH